VFSCSTVNGLSELSFLVSRLYFLGPMTSDHQPSSTVSLLDFLGIDLHFARSVSTPGRILLYWAQMARTTWPGLRAAAGDGHMENVSPRYRPWTSDLGLNCRGKGGLHETPQPLAFRILVPEVLQTASQNPEAMARAR
jgi:hypothetical protein